MATASTLAPPMPQSLPIPNRLLPVLVCAATGLLGGLALMRAAHATMVTGPVLGVLYGVLFALLFSNRASSAGSGLLWGLAYALLLWLAVVTVILQLVDAGVTSLDQLRTNRDNFPDLVGYILCFGAPLGLVLGTLQSAESGKQARAVQRRTSHRGRNAGGRRGRMGLRQMDGASQFLSVDRRLGWIEFKNGR